MNVNKTDCSPGSHPHADRPNWQPAETAEEYLSNVREGLEEMSERRLAKLLGWSRGQIWRAKQMAAIPDDLFNLLMASGCRSTKALAAVGQAMKGGSQSPDVERCPHCGEVVRVRGRWTESTRKIVNDWLREQSPEVGSRSE